MRTSSSGRDRAAGRTVLLAATMAACMAASCARYHARPLDDAAVSAALAPPDRTAVRIASAQLAHPLLRPVTVDLEADLGPDQIAALAVLLNPSLRAVRDQRALADAQVVQAGILPNPTVSWSLDRPLGAGTEGTVDALGVGVGWDISSLIGRDVRKKAAQTHARAIDLDVAWQEWQVAEQAKAAAIRVAAVTAQIPAAEEIDGLLARQLADLRTMIGQGEANGAELTTSTTASEEARATLLDLRLELIKQRLALNRLLGAPPGTAVHLAAIGEPLAQTVFPDPARLSVGLERRRLDLCALRLGYTSQEESLRAAILAQFPRIHLGLQRARDTSDISTIGFGVELDLPLFDRNQGAIATQTATRQQLFDEYLDRVAGARSDIALALAELAELGSRIGAAQAVLPGLTELATAAATGLASGDVDRPSADAAAIAAAQKRLHLIRLWQSWHEARIALEVAAGCCLENDGGLDFGPSLQDSTP